MKRLILALSVLVVVFGLSVVGAWVVKVVKVDGEPCRYGSSLCQVAGSGSGVGSMIFRSQT
jgi:hypothetical protein